MSEIIMDRHLSSIQRGYAEVYYGDEDDLDAPWGYVTSRQYVDHTDFEKEKVYYVQRWKVFRYDSDNDQFLGVGRLFGYKTRKEAIAKLDEYVEQTYPGKYRK